MGFMRAHRSWPVAIIAASSFLICPTVAVSGQNSTAPYDPARSFSPRQLEEDFEIARRALEEAHGAYDYYSTKRHMDRVFDKALAALDQPVPRQY